MRRPLRSGPLALALASLTAFACAGPSGPSDQTAVPPQTVRHVDLDRYAGTWYEIASFPHRFQRGCVATTATYEPRDDGRIRVRNRCRAGGLEADERGVDGVAWPVDETNAKLRVRFFWPFTGDYWVIALDPDYQWVVVGHPQREYLWILARTPQIDASLYEALREKARAQGFDVSRLERTLQPGA
ncbi:lipocalin family protein [Myxococcota bacterium]|nr:lipocalin family protein [Myxococcota bacterium]MCZ7620351.1 lipocalin family protein [Myxococcota bacterium]